MSEELQNNASFQPAATFVVKDLETLKVLSDPMRIQILEHMSEPRTVKQVAAELGLAPTKLYYHINMLEEHGLIKVMDTRIVSGIIEKRYQIVAMRFMLDQSLLNMSEPDAETSLDAMFSSIFELTKEEAKRSLHAGLLEIGKDTPAHRRLSLSRSLMPMTDAQAEDFHLRLDELIKEFSHDDGDYKIKPDEQIYAMTFALYPTTYNPNKEQNDEQPE